MSDVRDSEPMPGYRTRDLSNDEAWDAMQRAANDVVRAVLAARKDLLDLGFAADHSLCKRLDASAEQYAIVHGAVRVQRRHPGEHLHTAADGIDCAVCQATWDALSDDGLAEHGQQR